MTTCALHADDFGMNRAVTEGILQGFSHGLLTSTAVLANAPDASRALERWKQLAADHQADRLPSAERRRVLGDPDCPFDLGVHLNLTQGRPLTEEYPAELLDEQGRFPGIFRLFARLWRGSRFCAALEDELSRQIEFVLDHGLRPSHLNGHQYVEILPVVAEVVAKLLVKYNIPAVRVAEERLPFSSLAIGEMRLPRWLVGRVQQAYARRFRARVDGLGISHPDGYFGTAHAGRASLIRIQRFLKTANGARLVEIGLHPGLASTESSLGGLDGWHDPLATRRPGELTMLQSEELVEWMKSQNICLGRLTGEHSKKIGVEPGVLL